MTNFELISACNERFASMLTWRVSETIAFALERMQPLKIHGKVIHSVGYDSFMNEKNLWPIFQDAVSKHLFVPDNYKKIIDYILLPEKL